MELLVDLFGYLTIVLHGLVITGQSVAVGTAAFLALVLDPLAWMFGPAGDQASRRCVRAGLWGALALVAAALLTLALDGAILAGTLGRPPLDIAGTEFAQAELVRAGGAALIALLLPLGRRARWFASLIGLAVIAAGAATTHSVARLEHREILFAVSALHQLGAALWIGAIPAFVASLGALDYRAANIAIGERFSRLCLVAVAMIAASAGVLWWFYIGDFDGLYGTAYGVMVATKSALFLLLLALGAANNRAIRAMAGDIHAPRLRLRRFAEVEIGIGITLFFAAASVTSVPPAVDLPNDRVSWQEIVERNAPVWPRLQSPDHDALTLPALQAKLDAEAAKGGQAAAAFVPGSGEIPARNAEDIAWSEYNHHWAGIFVALIGLLALLHRAGLGPARHWPLAFLALAAFLFVRSDPEVWPMGSIGFLESLRDVEVLQHRFFVLLIVVFGLFEWRVRLAGLTTWPALVFPLVTALGGAALLTHSHAIANIKDQLLIELTHTPLALAGIVAGWARWVELRAEGREARLAGWLWPACFVLVGAILLIYREA